MTVAAPGWRPDPSGLQHVVGMLRESTDASCDQATVLARLEAYATRGDFNNYLAFILARGESGGEHAGVGAAAASGVNAESVRQAAGLLLKNNLKSLYKNLAPDIRAYINNELLSAIGDDSLLVRSAVAVCITAIVSKAGLQVWPDLFPTLVSCLDSNHDSFLDGALHALSRICEDVPDLLDQDPSQPLDVIIPKLLSFFQHPNDVVRVRVIHILNQFLLLMPPALNDNMDAYLGALFRVAEDASPEVRKRVCSAICTLLETKPEALAVHMPNIVAYMINASRDPSPLVSLEACEFWSACANADSAAPALKSSLPTLIPILLHNMVYSEDDQALFTLEQEDEGVPDRVEDTRPRFHTSRLEGGVRCEAMRAEAMRAGSLAPSTSPLSPGSGGSQLESARASPSAPPAQVEYGSKLTLGPAIVMGEDVSVSGAVNGALNHRVEESDEDEDDDAEEIGSEWNLRKSSAAALDTLASVYSEDVLSILLPCLQESLLNRERWEIRESGVLALGAVADACYSGIAPHMQTLFPYLLNSLQDSHHRVRVISCWTLSRYMRFVLESRGDSDLVVTVLKALSERILDRNKIVQRSACSAFASLEEQAGRRLLSPHIAPILQTVASAFEKYQQNNFLCLYDVICSLADAVGDDLVSDSHMNLLMPPLVSRWTTLADDDVALIPLFECMVFVVRAYGPSSSSFALPLYGRCVNAVEGTYRREAAGTHDDALAGVLSSSLDLLSTIAEVLGPRVDSLLVHPANGRGTLLQLLYLAMKDRRPDVRQSAFAVVGQFGRKAMPSLIPVLVEYVKVLVASLNPEYMQCANKATWALGEVVMMAGLIPGDIPLDRGAIQSVLLEQALPCLVRSVNLPQVSRALVDNSTIALGRVGLVMPDAVAPHLQAFAEPACVALRSICDDVDKEHTFSGINAMIKLNPGGIMKCFAAYAEAVAHWNQTPPKLELDFRSIFVGYKDSLGDQWYALYDTCPADLRRYLDTRFALKN